MMTQERFVVLDGWRAISILMVLAAHLLPLGPKVFQLNVAAGLFGMVLFFNLSGFLITHFLLNRPDAGFLDQALVPHLAFGMALYSLGVSGLPRIWRYVVGAYAVLCELPAQATDSSYRSPMVDLCGDAFLSRHRATGRIFEAAWPDVVTHSLCWFHAIKNRQ
jgi:hypothetical protein